MEIRTSSNLLVTNNNQLVIGIMSEFSKSVHDNVFYRNRQGLISNSKLIYFSDDKWECNPRLFCHEYYTEQLYYPIILLANDLGSMFEFKKTNLVNGIICPTTDIINTVFSYYKIEE